MKPDEGSRLLACPVNKDAKSNTSQIWKLDKKGRLINEKSKFAASLKDGSKEAGTSVIAAHVDKSKQQLWTIEDGQIVNNYCNLPLAKNPKVPKGCAGKVFFIWSKYR